MKPGKRQKMGYDGRDTAEGEKNKRLGGEREGRIKEGRSKCLIFQESQLNGKETISTGKIRSCIN